MVVKQPSATEPLALLARRRFIKSVFLFALLHYGVVLGLSGIIFLAIHFPPKAANIDGVIAVLVSVENVFVAPRRLLLWLWPSETTPRRLGLVVTLINSSLWGLGLATVKVLWRKVTL